jgi:hypothetical protein
VRTRTTLLYALPLLLLVAAVVLGLTHGQGPGSGADDSRPLALPPVEAPDAAAPACAALLAALPGELSREAGALPRLPLAEPAPPATLAWGRTRNEPVVLRCGLPRPAELVPSAAIVAVDGVNWLTLSAPDRDTFITADRPVYVALTVPRGLGSTPLQAVSDAVRTAVPAG